MEPWPDVCRTFGSGVIQPYNGSSFYVRSSCPFLLTRFTHNRVECTVTTQRDDSGLLVRVEIIVNKVRTILQNGIIRVEGKRSALIPRNTFFKLSNIILIQWSWSLGPFLAIFFSLWQYLPPLWSHLPAYLWVRHLHQAEELPDSTVCHLARCPWRNRYSLGVQTLSDYRHNTDKYRWILNWQKQKPLKGYEINKIVGQ